jgi:transposase
MVNAIVWVLKTGAPWRDLPEHYGSWETVYSRFRRWTKRGVWAAVLAELAKNEDGESYLIDATIVRAHQDASGARKKTAANSSVNPEADRPRKFMLASTPKAIRFIST